MASSTEIANLALSHLGVGSEISDLDMERSQEALACRRFYSTARNATLRDFPWPFATKIAALGLIEEDPNDEWGYSYQYPSDCLDAIRILSGIRNDNRQSRVPYKLANGDSGQVIFTDQEDAELEYTKLETDTSRYPPDFVLALSLRLAAYIAPRLTGGDPFKVGTRAFQMYEAELNRAKASGTEENQAEEDPESELIRARD
jgi:hypothetical protein